MITRGIIEKSIDEYHVKIRLPSVDRVDTSSVHTSTDNLNTAILATLPGCQVRLQPGDVVIVSIEESEESATILGYLYRKELLSKRCNYNANSIVVTSTAYLPQNTVIGDVQSDEISYLKGLNENLQQQLDEIKSRLTSLEER